MLAIKPDRRYRFKNFIEKQLQKENTQQFERDKNSWLRSDQFDHTNDLSMLANHNNLDTFLERYMNILLQRVSKTV